MMPSKPSCVVALSTERNCATDTDSATEGATGTALETRKAMSLQELRAQLRAQLARNQNPANDAIPPAESCGVALPIERNRATGNYAPYLLPKVPKPPYDSNGSGYVARFQKTAPSNDTAAAPFDQEWFEERAAIYEYDSGFSRQEAEHRAYLEVTKWMH